MTRKKVNEHVGDFDGFLLEGTFEEAISALQGLRNEYGDDCFIDYEQERYDDYWTFNISRKRDETPTERKTRLAKDKAIKLDQEDYERKQYEKLKKKYGEG